MRRCVRLVRRCQPPAEPVSRRCSRAYHTVIDAGTRYGGASPAPAASAPRRRRRSGHRRWDLLLGSTGRPVASTAPSPPRQARTRWANPSVRRGHESPPACLSAGLRVDGCLTAPTEGCSPWPPPSALVNGRIQGQRHLSKTCCLAPPQRMLRLRELDEARHLQVDSLQRHRPLGRARSYNQCRRREAAALPLLDHCAAKLERARQSGRPEGHACLVKSGWCAHVQHPRPTWPR